MTTTAITRTTPPGKFMTAGVLLTETAADVSGGNSAVLLPGQILLAHNTDSGSHTVTITSVALNGRTGTITAESIAAGALRVYGPLGFDGWRQTDGQIYFSANDATVKFSIIDPVP